jgi:hypothetical protein
MIGTIVFHMDRRDRIGAALRGIRLVVFGGAMTTLACRTQAAANTSAPAYVPRTRAITVTTVALTHPRFSPTTAQIEMKRR